MFIQLSLFILTLTLVLLNSLFWSVGSEYGYLATLATIPTLILALFNTLVGHRDIIHPSALLSYLLLISVSLKTFFLIYFDPLDTYKSVSLGIYDLEVLEQGCYAMIVAVVAWIIGQLMVSPKIYRGGLNWRYELDMNSAKWMMLLVIPIAASSILYFIQVSGAADQIASGQIFTKRLAENEDGVKIGAAFTYLRMLGQTLPHVAFLAFFASYLSRQERGSKKFKILAGILFLLCFVLPLLASARLEIAYFLIFLIMILHYVRKRLNTARLAALGLVLLAAIAFLGEIRTAQINRAGYETEFSLFRVVQNTIGRTYFMDISKTSAIVAAVPEKVDYLYGESLWKIFVAPIPRSIWPEKPILALNILVNKEILERVDDSGVPPGAVGEFYMNFGFTGIFVGMLVVGFLSGYLYNRMLVLIRSGDNFAIVYLIVILLLSFTLMTVEFLNFVSAVFRYLAMFFLFVFPFMKRKPLLETQS